MSHPARVTRDISKGRGRDGIMVQLTRSNSEFTVASGVPDYWARSMPDPIAANNFLILSPVDD